jgi:hypothetical protein
VYGSARQRSAVLSSAQQRLAKHGSANSDNNA